MKRITTHPEARIDRVNGRLERHPKHSTTPERPPAAPRRAHPKEPTA